MSTSDYERVKQAVLEAQTRFGEERRTFLREIEDSDSRLAAEIRGLLDHEVDSLPTVRGAWITSLLPCASTPIDRLGPYAIEAELGRGGAGVVYQARDDILDRPIALKVLPPEISRHPRRLERFRSEARLLASINHPNIATIYSLDAEHTPPFISLELVEGETLAQRLARGPISVDEALQHAQQIARALEAAHAAGVVHRDLKPANVMVTPSGLVKVVDFGLAVVAATVPNAETVPTTHPTVVEGTPGYMSPEQILGAAIDTRTDVWAYGCVLFECLTGRPALDSGFRLDLRTHALEGDLDWDLLPRSVPVRLRDQLRCCLDPDPARRSPTLVPIREEIEEAIFQHKMSRTGGQPTSIDTDRPHNLPASLDTFIGRKSELDHLLAQLRGHRIVTLTGAGGSGKTRLALEAARRLASTFEDGVWFVDLSSLESPGGVAEEVARTLGVAPDGTQGPLERVRSFVTGKRMLIVLDNCEHLRDGSASLVQTLVQNSPRLFLLITSREALRVSGEVLASVQPLRVDDGPQGREALGSEAVRLFLARAASADPEFVASSTDLAAVVDICRRLDGIPLAIELAAARVRALTVSEIAEHLGHRFSLLGIGDADGDPAGKPPSDRPIDRMSTTSPRHRSLHALIDWTGKALSPMERAIFRRLSVFRGGWTLPAAEGVCVGDGVPSWDFLETFVQLVEKSLVQRDPAGASDGGRSRYRMYETIREFAFDRLTEQDEETRVTTRHVAYFLSQAQAAETGLKRGQQTEWVKKIDADHANYRRALSTSLEDRQDPRAGMAIAAALGEYWQIRGYYVEAADIYRSALAMDESRQDTDLRGRLLAWAGNVALARGRYEEARKHHEEGVRVGERNGNRRAVGGALNSLGIVAWRLGDLGAARACYTSAANIWRELGDDRLRGIAHNNLGVLDMETGDYANARSHYEHSLAIHVRLGTRHAEGVLRANIGLAAMQLGEYDDARAAFERSLAIRREVGDRPGIAHSLNGLGTILERLGKAVAARPLLEESLTLYEEVGDRVATTIPLVNLGFVALHLNDPSSAEVHFRRAHERAVEAEDRANTARACAGLGMVAIAQGHHQVAATRLWDGLQGLHAVEDRWGVAMVLESVASLLYQIGRPAQAAQVLGFLETERGRLGAPRTAFQQADHDAMTSQLWGRLGPKVLSRQLAAGHTMTPDQIIDLARPVTGSKS